jgi:hypothetical protein
MSSKTACISLQSYETWRLSTKRHTARGFASDRPGKSFAGCEGTLRSVPASRRPNSGRIRCGRGGSGRPSTNLRRPGREPHNRPKSGCRFGSIGPAVRKAVLHGFWPSSVAGGTGKTVRSAVSAAHKCSSRVIPPDLTPTLAPLCVPLSLGDNRSARIHRLRKSGT